MLFIKQRQGSSAVFLAVILAAVISITLSLVFAGRNLVKISIADGALNLASSSVLSEYDYYVQRDYGLFLIQGTDSELTSALRDYSGYDAKAAAGRFSTVNTDLIRDQIIGYMKSTGAADMLRRSADQKETDSSAVDRTLRHGPTIISLPSRALPDKSIVATAQSMAESFTNPDAVFRSGTKKYLMSEYILQKFNRAEVTSHPDHFFSSEVEYIICGELSDEKNRAKTDLALEALRTGLNLSHIYSDPEKVAAISAAAETVTPGPLGALTQAGIAAAWAAAESVNDVRLLHDGCRVPIVKTSASWALDLDSVIQGLGEGSCVHPQIDTGRDYDDYLRILLYAKDETIKTARILDLVQINMRKNYDSEFLIQECAAGISVDGEVCGRSLSYDRIY